MVDDLGQEVLGALALRVGEELVRVRLFDDLAVGKEDDAVCRLAGGAGVEIRRAINDNKPLSGSQAKK